jgi:hypothetical protein
LLISDLLRTVWDWRISGIEAPDERSAFGYRPVIGIAQDDGLEMKRISDCGLRGREKPGATGTILKDGNKVFGARPFIGD